MYLVVPTGAVHPMTGGGQRTRILFDVLRSIHPVTVVLLGVPEDTDAGVFFPGAARVVGLPVRSFDIYATGRIGKVWKIVRRVCLPRADMAAEPDLKARLDEMTRKGGRSIVVFRYYLTFARSGLTDESDADRRVIVDVDDRDDRKMAIQLRSRLGAGAGSLAARALTSRVRSLMTERLRAAGHVWVAKEEDLFAAPDLNQSVVPNVPFASEQAKAIGPAGEGKSVMFIGGAGHMPNRQGVLWFLKNCWPRVHAAVPDAIFKIVGFGDWAEVASRYGDTPGVRIVGTVDNLPDAYSDARVVVCPIREGAGSQIKVIEGCAYARPVVATTLSGSGFGREIAAAIEPVDEADAFAEKCISYLRDAAAATSKGNMLQNMQRRYYSRASVTTRIAEDLAGGLSVVPAKGPNRHRSDSPSLV
ncbi:glycosyltransferase family 4 protein [uncultured Jannaschia sp.]|uniref:glycosyltransferase family 4 protein n=1 Tax=uncultured Jannaschia sp. TaxID=293347 RepID=UPI0026069501|nr:glycosyltransferase family 4 protein [uncultured Jannaschia sp.]